MKHFYLLIIVLVFLSGCAKADVAAARIVEQYITAMVEGNVDLMTPLVCSEFEDQAASDADAFIGVSAELSEMECNKSGSDVDTDLVECSGTIIATYGNEQQTFDLAGPVYRVIQQGGNWLICGRQ